jgi:hypothetical protein
MEKPTPDPSSTQEQHDHWPRKPTAKTRCVRPELSTKTKTQPRSWYKSSVMTQGLANTPGMTHALAKRIPEPAETPASSMEANSQR